MPRLQVLNARTPCCGKLVHLRESVRDGSTYVISCKHYPDGRRMTVYRNTKGALTCAWEGAADDSIN